MSPAYRRLTFALLLSLLFHGLLLSLTFGSGGTWLPGLGVPWQSRLVDSPDLRVQVMPDPEATADAAVPPVAEPTSQASAEPSVRSGPALTRLVSRPSPESLVAASVARERDPHEPVPSAATNARAEVVAAAASASVPAIADRAGESPTPPLPAPSVIAVQQTEEETFTVPAPLVLTPHVVAKAPSVSIAETTPSLRDGGAAERARIDREARERALQLAQVEASRQDAQRQAERIEAARQEAARQDTARFENARTEVERQDAARRVAELGKAVREVAAPQEASLQEAALRATNVQEAARIEAARAEAARVEAARVEAARVEAARVEAARIEAARVEAARIEGARAEATRAAEAAHAEATRAEATRAEAARAEAARGEAARGEAARGEAARAEAARAEVARGEAARAEAGRIESARLAAVQEAAAKREERLRAIGRQLDEENDRRDAAARLPPTTSSIRRYRLFGRSDPNAEVIQYAEAWGRKIQLNNTFDMVREAAKQPHTAPLVTVAVRSDGSVESVTFVQSSGVPAIDEAIRRIVKSQTPYQVFPPGLAREYDVVEIRRTWTFDMAIRLN